MRRLLAVSCALLLSIGFVSMTSLPAMATSESSEQHSDSVRPDLVSAVIAAPGTFGPGELVTIDWTVRENVMLDTVAFKTIAPSGHEFIVRWDASRDPAPLRDGDLWRSTSTARVDENWASGSYSVVGVWMYEDRTNGNYIDLRERPELGPGGFEVVDTDGDVVVPELVSARLTSPSIVGPGDTISIEWTVREDRSLNNVQFHVGTPGDGGEWAYWDYSHDLERDGDLWTGTSTILVGSGRDWPTGTYTVGTASISDGGTTYVDLGERADLALPTFEVTEAPTVTSSPTPTPTDRPTVTETPSTTLPSGTPGPGTTEPVDEAPTSPAATSTPGRTPPPSDPIDASSAASEPASPDRTFTDAEGTDVGSPLVASGTDTVLWTVLLTSLTLLASAGLLLRRRV